MGFRAHAVSVCETKSGGGEVERRRGGISAQAAETTMGVQLSGASLFQQSCPLRSVVPCTR